MSRNVMEIKIKRYFFRTDKKIIIYVQKCNVIKIIKILGQNIIWKKCLKYVRLKNVLKDIQNNSSLEIGSKHNLNKKSKYIRWKKRSKVCIEITFFDIIFAAEIFLWTWRFILKEHCIHIATAWLNIIEAWSYWRENGSHKCCLGSPSCLSCA